MKKCPLHKFLAGRVIRVAYSLIVVIPWVFMVDVVPHLCREVTDGFEGLGSSLWQYLKEGHPK